MRQTQNYKGGIEPGHPNPLEHLLQKRQPDPERGIDENGNTQLMQAVKRNDLEAVKMWLRLEKSKKAFQNLAKIKPKPAKKKEPFTIKDLAEAWENWERKQLRRMRKYENDINHRNFGGATALMIAAENGFTDILKFLLENDDKPEIADGRNNTALIKASKAGHVAAVTEILKYDKKINHKNHLQRTALMEAVISGKIEAAKILLENRADVDSCDENGTSILMHAVGIYGTLDIVKLLISYKPEVNYSNNSWSALFEATSWGRKEIMEVLLQNDAKPDKVDTQGSMALQYAAASGSPEAVKLLLDYKVPINHGNVNGWTALMEAASKRKMKTLKVLLENDADVSLKDKEKGKTAIYHLLKNWPKKKFSSPEDDNEVTVGKKSGILMGQ